MQAEEKPSIDHGSTSIMSADTPYPTSIMSADTLKSKIDSINKHNISDEEVQFIKMICNDFKDSDYISLLWDKFSEKILPIIAYHTTTAIENVSEYLKKNDIVWAKSMLSIPKRDLGTHVFYYQILVAFKYDFKTDPEQISIPDNEYKDLIESVLRGHLENSSIQLSHQYREDLKIF
jgi:hypothetical protein